MINVTHRTRLQHFSFHKYLALEHWSNSKIKESSRPFEETPKTRIGKIVDAIITGEPYYGDPGEIKIAKGIAENIMNGYGKLIDMCDKQVSYMAELEYSGFMLPFKTRPDFELPGVATIDLKVSWNKVRDIDQLITFMGYDTQCYIHRLLSGLDRSALMIYSVPDKRVINIEMKDDKADSLIPYILDYGSIR